MLREFAQDCDRAIFPSATAQASLKGTLGKEAPQALSVGLEQHLICFHSSEFVVQVVKNHSSEFVVQVAKNHSSEFVVQVVKNHSSEFVVQVVKNHSSEFVVQIVKNHSSEFVVQVFKNHSSKFVAQVVKNQCLTVTACAKEHQDGLFNFFFITGDWMPSTLQPDKWLTSMVVEKLQSCMIGCLATLWLSTTVGILILGDWSLVS